jgi:hypothetical protein
LKKDNSLKNFKLPLQSKLSTAFNPLSCITRKDY